jgi:hypothetical protein
MFGLQSLDVTIGLLTVLPIGRFGLCGHRGNGRKIANVRSKNPEEALQERLARHVSDASWQTSTHHSGGEQSSFLDKLHGHPLAQFLGKGLKGRPSYFYHRHAILKFGYKGASCVGRLGYRQQCRKARRLRSASNRQLNLFKRVDCR